MVNLNSTMFVSRQIEKFTEPFPLVVCSLSLFLSRSSYITSFCSWRGRERERERLLKRRKKGFAFLNHSKAMDTSNPAAFVNAELLPNFIGKRVRTVVQVNQCDDGVTAAKSTDDKQLTVKGLPQVPLMNYVEVIGIAESNHSINAEIWTDFGNTFDTNSYNQLCQLANGEFRGLFL